MDLEIKYIDRHNLGELDWDQYQDGAYYRNLFALLIEKGSLHFISNVKNDIGMLAIEDRLYPIVLGNRESIAHRSYVASLYSQYVSYGKREIELEFKQPILRFLGKALLSAIAHLCSFSNLDEVVFVNNWLLSTNLYPKQIPFRHLELLQAFLKHKFPHKAICFRSLNPFLNQNLIEELQMLGFEEVFSRKVFLASTEPPRAYRKKRNFGHDLRLFNKQKNQLTWTQIKQPIEGEINRIRELYQELYLGKYAQLNPNFTADFFRHLIGNGILSLYVLKEREDIVAVLGYFLFAGVQTASVIGYDRTISKRKGLYRLISLKIVELAEENKAVIHASSGVSAFKASRGLTAFWEYNLIDWSGVKKKERISWKALKFLANDISIPLMKKLNI
ncbi:MAG: hypothetical protein R8P61_12095 [Bacteroidia bacterium]|nr:hypothetical protein [Bacteroidia bacterium]